MRRMSIKPWGGIALLMAVAVALWPAAPRAQEPENPFTSRIDVRMGRQSYQARCATCHGINATGNPEAGGPDLSTGQFSRAEGNAGLFRVIREGIEGTAMIGLGSDSTEQSVWQLVTFLRSLAPTGIDPGGSAAAGEALFAGNGGCARCHMVNGDGGRLGPDLSLVGDRRTPGELATDLVDPGRRGASPLVDDPRDRTRRRDCRGPAHERGHLHVPHHGRGREPPGFLEVRRVVVRADRDLHHARLRGDADRAGTNRSRGASLFPAEGPMTLPPTSSARLWTVLAAVALAAGPAAAQLQAQGPAEGAPVFAPVTWERLVNAADEPHNWLMYNGTLDSQRFSRLDQIDRGNVGDLELKWAHHIPQLDRAETTPLVVDGVMFITESPSNVVAVDAVTGRPFWRYDHVLPDDLRVCCGRNNRGVAILDDLLFMSTLDAHLVAIDARTGSLVWNREVADHRGRVQQDRRPPRRQGPGSDGHRRGRVRGPRVPRRLRRPHRGARVADLHHSPDPTTPTTSRGPAIRGGPAGRRPG